MNGDRKLIAESLHMRANWIETGNVLLSGADLTHQRLMGNKRAGEIKTLTRDQVTLAIKLRDLAGEYEKS